MKIVAVIILFVFGNMNDQETQMTQYIPMSNAGECLYEKRMLKKNKDFPKDAFCGPAYVEISENGNGTSNYRLYFFWNFMGSWCSYLSLDNG